MISCLEAFKYRCFDRLDIKLGQSTIVNRQVLLLDIPLLFGSILSRGLVPAFLESPSIAGSPGAQSLQELLHVATAIQTRYLPLVRRVSSKSKKYSKFSEVDDNRYCLFLV